MARSAFRRDRSARPGRVRLGALAALVAPIALVLMVAACRKEVAGLPNVGARADQTTVSGLSGGAYMAGQFQMAHARIVRGAGIVAGGPYGCADSVHADQMPGPAMMLLNVAKAVNGCMFDNLRLWDVANPERLAARARQLAKADRIDPIEDVIGDKVFLFTGSRDSVVAPSIVAAARAFYQQIGVPETSIQFVDTIAAGHGLVTENDGAACGETGQPYVVKCGYDLAGQMLTHLLGPLAARSARPMARLQAFDQRPFLDGLSEHGLADEGTVYIPEACRTTAGCRIHVAFHGCNQNRQTAGDAFAASGALLQWADTNRLVVLFPQVAQGALNPQGCWDWWGYTGRDYSTRKGPQVVAVKRMVDRLSGDFSGS